MTELHKGQVQRARSRAAGSRGRRRPAQTGESHGGGVGGRSGGGGVHGGYRAGVDPRRVLRSARSTLAAVALASVVSCGTGIDALRVGLGADEVGDRLRVLRGVGRLAIAADAAEAQRRLERSADGNDERSCRGSSQRHRCWPWSRPTRQAAACIAAGRWSSENCTSLLYARQHDGPTPAELR